MSERTSYPPGVPCWVDTLQPDPQAARAFYGRLFGWEYRGPGPMPDGARAYHVAQSGGRDVAGIGSLPARAEMPGTLQMPAAWNTHIRVRDAEESAEHARRCGGSVLVAPFDALPAGRMAVLADPSGAAFCIWEARTREGAQCINEPNAWAMSALHTADIAAAAAFYGNLFGWQADAFDIGDETVTLWRLPGYVGGEPEQPVPRDVVAVADSIGAFPPGTMPFWGIDFWIADADAAVARAQAAGGRVLNGPCDSPMFRQAVLADPAGAFFSISQLIRSK